MASAIVAIILAVLVCIILSRQKCQWKCQWMMEGLVLVCDATREISDLATKLSSHQADKSTLAHYTPCTESTDWQNSSCLLFLTSSEEPHRAIQQFRVKIHF